MIQSKELNKYTAAFKVSDRQIEKDYILSWVLHGIAKHEVLRKSLVFKGGTVLKKCYVEDYRFSEDLDFTLVDDALQHADFKSMLNEVFEWVKEEANIPLQHKEDDIHEASKNSLFYVNYVGPLGGAMGSRDIKIDITRGEVMEFQSEEKKVFINYSDLPEESFTLLCYPLTEIMIEKMAALMGRTEPRDLYDFWYLLENEGIKLNHIKKEFSNKAKNKGHDPEKFAEKVLRKETGFKKDWENKLQNQIHDLPKFDDVFRETKRYLR